MPKIKKTAVERELELENYLIDHWSVSAVSEFIRNEKNFERKYIFRVKDSQKSLASIIGMVYHQALMYFFLEFKNNRKMGFDELIGVAHERLDDIPATKYQPQKKKTIEELKVDALKALNMLIKSFLEEFSSYESVIGEILFVEEPFKEYVTINGLDIPLPLKVIPDLVFIHKDGSLAVMDHKAKRNYTPEKDVTMRYSLQSESYTLALNAFAAKLPKPNKIKGKVKHFFFYENKYSKNKDGSNQIRQIPIDMKASSPLFEQLLFEGVFRMLEAVSNPDYVYLMNPSDHYQDAGEMVNFWIKTHIEGIEGFPNIKPNARRLLAKKRSKIRRSALTGIPKSIVRAFTNPKDHIFFNNQDMENLTIEERIEHRLKTFSYPVKIEHKIDGYSCDTYLMSIAAGLKISGLQNYRLDIANAAGVRDVRIVPGQIEYKGGVYPAIEINKKVRKPLFLDKSEIPEGNVFPIGKTNFGQIMTWNIDDPSTPHMMISGSSGSGKSVAIRTIIETALQKGLEIVILDPKFEFKGYGENIKIYQELEDIEEFMRSQVIEMDEIFRNGKAPKKKLIIFDEAADCFTRQARKGVIEVKTGKIELDFLNGLVPETKEVNDKNFKTLEDNTLILAQKARSAGIHLVLAAQRFSSKILTGDAKANFTTRLCLTVAKEVDSRVMLDEPGAEKLNGKGDALYLQPGFAAPERIQCFTVSS